MTSPKISLKESIEASKDSKPFQQRNIGFMKLKRTIIPKDQCKRVLFYLDAGSSEALLIKATAMGLTTDELLRRAVWSLTA